MNNNIIIARAQQRPRVGVRLLRSPRGSLDVIVSYPASRGSDSEELRRCVDACVAEAIRRSRPSEQVRLVLRDVEGSRSTVVRYVYPGGA